MVVFLANYVITIRRLNNPRWKLPGFEPSGLQFSPPVTKLTGSLTPLLNGNSDIDSDLIVSLTN